MTEKKEVKSLIRFWDRIGYAASSVVRGGGVSKEPTAQHQL